MNKKVVVIILGVLVVGFVIGTYVFLNKENQPSPQQPGGQSLDPSPETRPTSQARDFINDPDVVSNTQSNGKKAYELGSDPTYFLSYSEENDFYGVIITDEDIASTRLKAEADLQKRLGIEKQQMCSLNYIVSVDAFFDEELAGKNLGFSFCPGSIRI